MVAVCDRAPDVPTKFTGTAVGVVEASEVAVKVTTNGVPGVTEIVAGDTVTPVGKPFTATATAPLKPAIAVLLSVTSPLPPGISASVPGVAVSAKSALDGPVPAVTVNATEVL